LLKTLLKPFGKRAGPGSPAVPEGCRVYAVGDIHGCDDLLGALHRRIERDAAAWEGRKLLVYLGDYIDRGPASKQVIDRLIGQPLAGFESVFLKGNHEQALLDFLDYPEEAASWLTFGGRETLGSYGIRTSPYPGHRELVGVSEALSTVLPDSHRDFFNNGRMSWSSGDYYFVHAGIRPGVALDRQNLDDQLWIREDFTESRADHGKIVVHGHTIAPEVELYPNRIGIDTGAFASGVLTCLVLEGKEQRLIQTAGDPVGGRHAGDN